MSYKALYRKYRPSLFNDIVGQHHIVKTLENIVLKDSISHAYLFVGPHGTGKTSTAHVFARSINCIDRHSEDKWSRCKLIDWKTEGIDIIEIDAASNNGVAEVRNIIDKARYVPAKLRYKVYIIDEVHMLSKGAFNALLKILEEPPKYVIFILATTEPEKIPATVLSRVQRYNFEKISNPIVEKHVKRILDNESIQYDDRAIKEIALLANGSMRDAISIADQTAAYGDGAISSEYISKVFGILSISNQVKLINMLMNNKVKDTLALLRTLYTRGVNIYKLTISLIDILKDWIIFEKTKDISLLTTLNEDLIYKLNLSKTFAYEASNELFEVYKKLHYSKNPKSLFELAILKISDFSIVKDKTEIINSTTKDFTLIPPEEIISSSFIKSNDSKLLENEEEKTKNAMEEKLSNNQRSYKTGSELILEDEISNQIVSEEKNALINEPLSIEESNIIPSDTESIIKVDLSSEFEKIKDLSQEITVDESVNRLPKETLINLTQEILNSDKTEEKEKQLNTSEIDISQMFSLDEINKIEKTIEVSKYDVNFLLSALAQSKKEIIPNIRQRLNTAASVVANASEQAYITYLSSTKVISAGESFVLLTSEHRTTVNELNNLSSDQNFTLFMDKVFGKPTNVYVISKEQFEEIKREWKNRKDNKVHINVTTIHADRSEMPKEQSNAEMLLQHIFGN